MKPITISKKNSTIIMLFLITCMAFQPSYSQGGSAGAPNQQGRILALDALYNRVKNNSKVEGISLNEIKGSPYLNKNFEKSILYHNNKPVGQLLSRYNIYSDEIEIKKNITDKEYSALIKSKLIACDLNGQKLIFSSYKPENKMAEEGYLICLSDPLQEYVLYKKIKVIFRDRGVEQSSSLSKRTDAKFAKFTSYFVSKKEDKLAQELPKKGKKIASAFSDQHESEISSFIKEQNINTKEEKDLVKLFNFINTLDPKI
ncbi:hypothetical protein [Aquimarina pacifica]|uniref:hypothetical protein n=1 Tax=Aquimarina pacifica TaxID=1296415 RepID=UPI000470BC59|nr:hypothetical protein [Aquimarina pacifica]